MGSDPSCPGGKLLGPLCCSQPSRAKARPVTSMHLEQQPQGVCRKAWVWSQEPALRTSPEPVSSSEQWGAGSRLGSCWPEATLLRWALRLYTQGGWAGIGPFSGPPPGPGACGHGLPAQASPGGCPQLSRSRRLPDASFLAELMAEDGVRKASWAMPRQASMCWSLSSLLCVGGEHSRLRVTTGPACADGGRRGLWRMVGRVPQGGAAPPAFQVPPTPQSPALGPWLAGGSSPPPPRVGSGCSSPSLASSSRLTLHNLLFCSGQQTSPCPPQLGPGS